MQLHDQVKYWKSHAEKQALALAELRRYANLEKFSGVNEGINRDDILLRIREAKQTMITELWEEFGEYLETSE